MEDRPGAVHSKENIVHMAAEVITHLPTGTALVKSLIGNRVDTAVVRLPFVTDAPEPSVGHACRQLLEKTPSARSSAEVDLQIVQRHEWLKTQAADAVVIPHEPDKPSEFRVPVRKRTGGRRSHDKPTDLPGAHPVKG